MHSVSNTAAPPAALTLGGPDIHRSLNVTKKLLTSLASPSNASQSPIAAGCGSDQPVIGGSASCLLRDAASLKCFADGTTAGDGTESQSCWLNSTPTWLYSASTMADTAALRRRTTLSSSSVMMTNNTSSSSSSSSPSAVVEGDQNPAEILRRTISGEDDLYLLSGRQRVEPRRQLSPRLPAEKDRFEGLKTGFPSTDCGSSMVNNNYSMTPVGRDYAGGDDEQDNDDADSIIVSGARKMSCTSSRDFLSLANSSADNILMGDAGTRLSLLLEDAVHEVDDAARVSAHFRLTRPSSQSQSRNHASIRAADSVDEIEISARTQTNVAKMLHQGQGGFEACMVASNIAARRPPPQQREFGVEDDKLTTSSSSDSEGSFQGEEDEDEDDGDDDDLDSAFSEEEEDVLAPAAATQFERATRAQQNTATSLGALSGSAVLAPPSAKELTALERDSGDRQAPHQSGYLPPPPGTQGPANTTGGDPTYNCLSAREWIAAYGPVRSHAAAMNQKRALAASNVVPVATTSPQSVPCSGGVLPPAQTATAAASAAVAAMAGFQLPPCAAAPQQIPPATEQQQRALKTRYSHCENALIYIAMASKMLEENEKQKQLNGMALEVANRQPFSVFKREPGDPLMKRKLYSFAERLATAMRCKYPCYVLALIYLRHVTQKHPRDLPVNSDTFQRLVAIAVVVSAKFYDDLYYSNEHYARQMGFPTETLNMLEVCFLVLLDFNLHVQNDEFQATMLSFDEWRRRVCAEENLPVWCGLSTAVVPAGLEIPFSPTTAAHGTPICATALLVSPAECPNVISDPGASWNAQGVDSKCPQSSSCGRSTAADAADGTASLDYATASLRRSIDTFMMTREMRGHRYECEEEYLFKSSLQSRCKVINKLLQQYNDECRKLADQATNGASTARHGVVPPAVGASAMVAAAAGGTHLANHHAANYATSHHNAQLDMTTINSMLNHMSLPPHPASQTATVVASRMPGDLSMHHHLAGLPLGNGPTALPTTVVAPPGKAPQGNPNFLPPGLTGGIPTVAATGAAGGAVIPELSHHPVNALNCPMAYSVMPHVGATQMSDAAAFGALPNGMSVLTASSGAHCAPRRPLDCLSGPLSNACYYHPKSSAATAAAQYVPQWV